MRNMSFDVFALRKNTAINILLKSLIWAFALFGVLVILLLSVLLSVVGNEGLSAKPMPEQAILTIDFDKAFSEVRPDNLWAEINGDINVSFLDLLMTIATASEDDSIRAIVGKISNSDLSLAQIQELRKVIVNFRQVGKKAYLFSNGFGNLGGGLSEYYLASAFDEIILQPNTDVGITGISIEMPFVRNLLDKIGIVPEFYSRYEYKNALVSFTDNKMSDTVREELSKLGDNLLNQIIDGIAISRKIMPEMLKKLVDKAPFTDQEAVEFKLVDRLLYQENLMDELEQKYSAKRADWKDYFAVLYQPDNNYPVIGTLILSGEIVEGESVLDPMNGEMAVGADTVVEQLNELAEIKNLRALIIRIDSPGGSYVASDIIRQAIADFKNDKKIPVIVSMSSSAASGGYFAALSADKIIADAATLTGSIGVLGGKPVFAKLWQKLGVEWDRVNFGKNSGILSFNTSFSDTEKKIFNRALDRIYEDFTNKVSDARGISKNELDKLARGRVWTGDQAVKMRLIDIVGGYNEAFAVAKEMAEMESNGAFKSVVYPRAKTIQEKIAELMSVSPFALMNKLKMQIGLDNTSVNVLNRLKYDAVMPPVVVKY